MRLNLKMAIHRRGTTQRRVARQIPMSENRLSDIVQGWADGTEQERAAIAVALGEAPDYLFAETGHAAEPAHQR